MNRYNDRFEEAELKTLLNNVTDIVLVGNKTDIYKCNKLAETFFHNSNITDFKHFLPSLGGALKIKNANTDLLLEFKDLPYNLALSGESYSIEIKFLDENNNIERYFHCKGAPVVLNKEIIGAVLILTEYTYKVNAQKSISKALNEVDEIKDLNKRLEKYSYAVAHDINSPLNNILGLSYMLLDEIGESINPEHKYFLESIYNSTKRLHEYVLSLLKLSQLNTESLEKEVFVIDTLIQELIESLTETHNEKNIEITYEKGILMYGDKSLCFAVFQNILSNAIKFSSEREKTKVHIGSELNDNNKQIIYIKDNGEGFDDKDADSLFVPKIKTSLSSKFSGYGIGLTTVQHIINSHGGRIWAKGSKGNGAVFYMYFPPANQ